MRILLSVDPEIPVPPTQYGGIERIVDGLITELRAQGHHIGLIAHPESTCPVDWQAAWPALHSQGAANTLRNMFALQGAVATFKPDVLHSFSRIAYMGRHLLSSLPKLMSYQRDPSTRTTGLASKLAGNSLAFTGCSGYIANLGRRASNNWHVVPNFAPVHHYDFSPSVAADAPLVFLSRLEASKGCHVAIEIAKRAGRRLIIAGNRVEHGSAVGYFAREIEPHVGKDGIEYVGAVNDVQKNQLLGQAAAMVVPIQWDEPFGIVFAESLACGTPVIATPRGAVPEIIEHARHGFHINDVEEGVAAVAKLPAIDRAKCREQALTRFAPGVVAREYVKIYQSLNSDQ
jgi:glycosyltransferase involved in cell wall biosynthesis